MKLITIEEYLPLVHNNLTQVRQPKFDLGVFLENEGFSRDLSHITQRNLANYLMTLQASADDPDVRTDSFGIARLFTEHENEQRYLVSSSVYNETTSITADTLRSYIEEIYYNKTLIFCQIPSDFNDNKYYFNSCILQFCSITGRSIQLELCQIKGVSLTALEATNSLQLTNCEGEEIDITSCASLHIENSTLKQITIRDNIFTGCVKLINTEFSQLLIKNNTFNELFLYHVSGLVQTDYEKNIFNDISSIVNLSVDDWDVLINQKKVNLSRGAIIAISYSWTNSLTMDLVIQGLNTLAAYSEKYANQILYLDNSGDYHKTIKSLPENTIDLIILPGGENIPYCYYQKPKCYRDLSVDIPNYNQRTHFELNLLRWADLKNIPVIGICRGLQLMGVWAGLSLTDVKDIVSHANSASMLVTATTARINPLYDLCRKISASEIRTNRFLEYDENENTYNVAIKCLHSQCIKTADIKDGEIEVLGAAPDGTIEFARFKSDRGTVLLGMQNHPEKVIHENPIARATMEWMVDLANKRMKKNSLS